MPLVMVRLPDLALMAKVLFSFPGRMAGGLGPVPSGGLKSRVPAGSAHVAGPLGFPGPQVGMGLGMGVGWREKLGPVLTHHSGCCR